MNLLDLPDEIIEGIFEFVQEDDILQLKLVNKAINLIIAGSVGIRYRLELFLAGLEDRRSDDPEPLGERLNKLRSWQSRWNQTGSSPSQTIVLPGRYASDKCCLHGGVFAMYNEGRIHFIRLPSPSRGVPLMSWHTPQLGFEPVGSFAMDPDQDLLVLVEREANDVLGIHIFDMHGKNHQKSDFPFPFLSLQKLRLPGTSIKSVRITIAGPNFAVLVILDIDREGGCEDSLRVFEWASGRPKLRLERQHITNAAFIDQFHLVTSSLDPQGKRSYHLGVHDLRQGSPHVLFELPPHSNPVYFNPGLFCHPSSGPVSAFHGSPTHTILTIVILEKISTGTTLVLVHPQSLYGLMRQGEPYIRWEQWADKAEMLILGTFWGEPENELQITAGLRLITPANRWHDHNHNPKLWLYTFKPWIRTRGDAKFPGMRFRAEELSFCIPESSPALLPLISEEHILWIDRKNGGSQNVNSLTIFPV